MVLEVPISQVLHAFEDAPKVVYSKEGIEKSKSGTSILGVGDSRSVMFQQRYYMILQQLFRDSKFVDTARGRRGAEFPMISFFGAEEAKKASQAINSQSLLLIHSSEPEESAWRFEITPVESLPGSTGIKIVFGMICKGEDGRLQVEDIHQSVPMKIDKVKASNDLITDNTFVLVKGEMIDEVFVAYEMTLPPIPRKSLCEASINLFGGPTELTEEIVVHTVGQAPEDASVAILSNVLLDVPSTLEKLNLLFTGFEECDAVPSVFVLMGNLSSKPFNPSSGDSLRSFQKSFEALAQLLGRHPATLEKSKIVIVPGNTDPGNGLYPQPPLSDILVRGLASRFPNVVLSTNPCRLRFHNKQIMLFSGDVVDSLRRSKLVASYHSADEEEGDKFARSILSQMHLTPGPVRNRAVVWDHDAGMRVYPPPHALFIADPNLNAFQKDLYGENFVVGMPSFASTTESTGEFHLYSPHSNESSLSNV